MLNLFVHLPSLFLSLFFLKRFYSLFEREREREVLITTLGNGRTHF